MRDRYTMRELVAALGVDSNTVARWLDAAGVTATLDTYDARRRYVAADDAARLAALHGRELRPLPDDAPKTLPAALAEIARLRARIAELERRPAIYPPQLTPQDGEANALPARDVPFYHPARQRPPTARVATHSADTLPAGWAIFIRFSERHNIPPMTAKAAVRDGRIAASVGRWKVGSVFVERALAPDEQRAFVAWARAAHPAFRPCSEPGCVCREGEKKHDDLHSIQD